MFLWGELQNNMERCLCADPLVPTNRIKEHTWNQAHLANNEAAVAHWARTLDVVFYGDSITEGWNETSYGRSATRSPGAKDVFQSLFSAARGGDYQGIALGIAGDTVRDALLKGGQNTWVVAQSKLKSLLILIFSLSPEVAQLVVAPPEWGATRSIVSFCVLATHWDQ
jgi:hypothetical protein